MVAIVEKNELYKDREYLYQKLIVEDMNYRQVAEEIGCVQSTVTRWANEYGIFRGELWQRAKAQYGDEIVRLYAEEDKTLKELGTQFGYVDQTIRRVLIECGIDIRTLSESKLLRDESYVHRIHSLNEDYFKTWSNEMAYILGLIYSDGNIMSSPYTSKGDGRTRNRNRLSIVLHEDDREILEKIKVELDYGGELFVNPSKISGKLTGENNCGLRVNSAELIKDLESIGLVERKSLIKTYPNVPQEFELDFIRGYFDGNGSVGKQYPTNSKKKRTDTCQIRIRICSGSKPFLEGLKDSLMRYGIKDKKISEGRSGTIFEVCYSTKESLMLYDLFYQNESSLKLKRKYDSFNSYIEQRKEDVKNSTGGIKIL